MLDLGYRACLVNKEGIRKPSDIDEWEFRIEESDERAPDATNPRLGKSGSTVLRDSEKATYWPPAAEPRFATPRLAELSRSSGASSPRKFHPCPALAARPMRPPFCASWPRQRPE